MDRPHGRTLAHAAEISGALSGPDWKRFLAGVFGNSPTRWSPALTGMDRLRVILNTLTRIRFLEVDGSMDFAHNRGLDEAPPELVPWFAHPLRRTADALVAFGGSRHAPVTAVFPGGLGIAISP